MVRAASGLARTWGSKRQLSKWKEKYISSWGKILEMDKIAVFKLFLAQEVLIWLWNSLILMLTLLYDLRQQMRQSGSKLAFFYKLLLMSVTGLPAVRATMYGSRAGKDHVYAVGKETGTGEASQARMKANTYRPGLHVSYKQDGWHQNENYDTLPHHILSQVECFICPRQEDGGSMDSLYLY